MKRKIILLAFIASCVLEYSCRTTVVAGKRERHPFWHRERVVKKEVIIVR